MAAYKMRITRKRFYELGGFRDPRLFRKATPTGAWTYWIVLNHYD